MPSKREAAHPRPPEPTENNEASASDFEFETFENGKKIRLTAEERHMLKSTFCEICGGLLPFENNPIILCDGHRCNKAYHLKCLTPPLDEVPAGDFLGPCCEASKRTNAGPSIKGRGGRSHIRRLRLMNRSQAKAPDDSPMRNLMSQFSESFRSRRKSAPVEYMDDEDEVPVVAQTDVGDDSPANSSVERSSVDGQAPTSWHRDLMVSHEKLLRDLEGIVGMEKIKELLIDINSKINLRKERVRRSLSSRDSGRPPTGSGMAPHIALIGNPGTGKSKIGKILARMLYRSHAVKRNILVKAHRSDLVAGFIGQTALKTAELIEQARGGILFVDEAHQLINPNKDDYGIEAYREIMKEMLSDHAVDEDRVTFIFAGYPKQMRRFLSHDAGMESRVSFRIHLPDYTLKEIGAICETKLASRDPGEGLPTRVEPGINLESMLHSLPLELVPRYNARISDLLLDKAEACLAKRMLLAPSPDESIDIFTLMAGDIRNAVVGLRNEMLQANSVNGSPDTSDADHTPKRR